MPAHVLEIRQPTSFWLFCPLHPSINPCLAPRLVLSALVPGLYQLPLTLVSSSPDFVVELHMIDATLALTRQVLAANGRLLCMYKDSWRLPQHLHTPNPPLPPFIRLWRSSSQGITLPVSGLKGKKDPRPKKLDKG